VRVVRIPRFGFRLVREQLSESCENQEAEK